ncbi:MAG: FAD-dependent oxidoreductase [Theionarchaea archaeon]|nr:FAD-dependent oxidoreductase [Theionarchaea archaeon]
MEFETSVQKIIPRTHTVKSFRFPRPSPFTYDPGQFFFITLRNNGKELSKHFTISSSPTEKGFLEFTKKLTSSDYSATLTRLHPGDWVKIRGPLGKFTYTGQYRTIALLTGGIGITPFRSICKYCTDMHLDTDIVLISGNHSETDIVFRDDFQDMCEQNEHLRVYYTLNDPSPGWEGFTGRIDTELITEVIPDYAKRIFYICGPPPMITAMIDILTELQVPEDHIKRERFSGY